MLECFFHLFEDNRREYNVGDEIKLKVTLRDGYNKTRSFGGDQLRVRSYTEPLAAYTSGYVIDHNNGTYTAILGAYWPGKQNIEIILAYRREIVRLLYYLRQKVYTKLRYLMSPTFCRNCYNVQI